MEWFQVLAIIVSMGGIVFWFQRENKADMRALQDEVRGWREDIHKEMKDFHGRLCAIEERRK